MYNVVRCRSCFPAALVNFDASCLRRMLLNSIKATVEGGGGVIFRRAFVNAEMLKNLYLDLDDNKIGSDRKS